MFSLGVDIGQERIDYCLYAQKENKNVLEGSATNDAKGFNELWATLLQTGYKMADMHVYMESTGGLENRLFEFLRNKVGNAFILNPKQVKRFKDALFQDHKCDAIDAQVLAKCVILPELKNNLKALKPQELGAFETMLKHREFLVRQKTAAILRQQRLIRTLGDEFAISLVNKQLSDDIENRNCQIGEIEKAMFAWLRSQPEYAAAFKRLSSIPGVGKVTGFTLLNFLGTDAKLFQSAEKFTAFGGVYPVMRQSGQWVGKRTLTSKGCRSLRTALYIAALASIRRPGKMRLYYDAKLKQNKKPKQVLIALANRLGRIAWAVVKNGQMYQEDKFMPSFA